MSAFGCTNGHSLKKKNFRGHRQLIPGNGSPCDVLVKVVDNVVIVVAMETLGGVSGVEELKRSEMDRGKY